MSRDAFAAYVQQQIYERLPASAPQHDGMILQVQLQGEPVRINLDDFYVNYYQNPKQLAAIIDSVLVSMQQVQPGQLVTDFAQLRPVIYPMLKPLDLLTAVREHNLPMLVYQPFLPDVMICYVINEQQQRISYINEQHLDSWQIDLETLHLQALANLRQHTAALQPAHVGAGAQQLFMWNSQDGYDATRLLLSEYLTRWQAGVPGDLVIGIPHRDLLIALNDHDPQTVMRVARQIQSDYAQHVAGLTDQLFTFVDGILQPYT
jgi:uncharacterized protein YtpQ (UPF0354 family)